MKFFSRKSRAVTKWHGRARMIDPKKTKLIFIGNVGARDVPSWVYREFASSRPDES